MQAAGSARYAHFAQIIHRPVPVLAGLFLFFRPARPVAGDDIIGVLSYLKRGPGRNLRVQRREAGGYVLAGDIVGGQQDRVETETDLRLPAAVGDTGIADELLFVEIIAEVLRHPLHKVEVGAFDHDPFPVLTNT